jgi:hypothetical protein
MEERYREICCFGERHKGGRVQENGAFRTPKDVRIELPSRAQNLM